MTTVACALLTSLAAEFDAVGSVGVSESDSVEVTGSASQQARHLWMVSWLVGWFGTLESERLRDKGQCLRSSTASSHMWTLRFVLIWKTVVIFSKEYIRGVWKDLAVAHNDFVHFQMNLFNVFQWLYHMKLLFIVSSCIVPKTAINVLIRSYPVNAGMTNCAYSVGTSWGPFKSSVFRSLRFLMISISGHIFSNMPEVTVFHMWFAKMGREACPSHCVTPIFFDFG